MVGRTVLAGSLALCALTGCGAAGDSADPGGPVAGPGGTASTVPRRGAGRVSRAVVTYVTDGDTIRARTGGRVVRVRLLGIDAPETKDPRKPVACYGPEASARARALMPPGAPVTLVTDPTQDERDRYGRLLAYVFTVGDRRPVNERLVRDGAARVYVFRPSRPFLRVAAFRSAESDARAASRGLWGRCAETAR